MPIDGLFPCVLVVRDLASLAILLAAPCLAMTADTAGFHFRQLFDQQRRRWCSRPTTAARSSPATRANSAGRHGVVNLLSTALDPAVQWQHRGHRGQPSKPARRLIAQQQSCDIWTSDILESARLAANALNLAAGAFGPHARRTLARPPPDPAVPSACHLRALIAKKTDQITQSIQRERHEKGLAAELTAACRATVVRTAIRQALVELGYLQIRRPANMSTESNAVLSRN